MGSGGSAGVRRVDGGPEKVDFLIFSINPHLQLINSYPPWKALRAGVKQGVATKFPLNGQKSVYFGTSFINWGGIGFTTAPATATATATATTTTVAAQRRLGRCDHGNGHDHNRCGSTTTAITALTMVTIAAIWWLRPRQRLRPPRPLRRWRS